MEAMVNGVRLWYEITGQGRPVLLVHGNGESHEIFDRLIPELSREFQVIAVDSRCHGRSEDPDRIHYRDMAEDMIGLIRLLGLQKPVFYGFSDGGIVGLLLAMEEPELLGKLIISGANLNPRGMKLSCRLEIRLQQLIRPDKRNRLMLREPDIRPEDLEQIRIPTVVLAGQRDVIREDHTRLIAEHIPGSVLKLLPGETHSSYIVHSEKLYGILRPCL